MTWIEFLAEVRRTNNNLLPEELQRAFLVIALDGEWGEFCNYFKKHMTYGFDLDPQRVADELGDCLWYIAALLEMVRQQPVDWPDKASTRLVDDRPRLERILLWSGITSIHLRRFTDSVNPPMLQSYSSYGNGRIYPGSPYQEGRALIARIVALAEMFGLSLDDVLATVVTKLRNRHPHGFNYQDSREVSIA